MTSFQEPLSGPRPLTVFGLNQLAKDLLEGSLGSVWVTGELSRVTRASSGHVYFALKDAESRIDAVLWSTAARRCRFPLSEGLHVNVRGQLTVYPPQGRYQLVCQVIEPAGEGALRAALLKLKAKLEAEGLLHPERKRPLPFLPRKIGLVTSPTGAALHDVLKVVWRRFPCMPVVVCPVRVQGPTAAAEICEALACLNRRDDLDVLIVARGGGSLEDLWIFNDERLVRAIAASQIPVVSAVGHEIDVTLADLVADVRALTPTEAGERAVPLHRELLDQVAQLLARLTQGTRRLGRMERDLLERLARRRGLNLFPARLAEERQGLDLLERRLRRALLQGVLDQRQRLQALGRTLGACSPSAWIRERTIVVRARGQALHQAAGARLAQARARVELLGRTLEALNPLAVLGRGFSITRAERNGRLEILREAADVETGATLRTTLRGGGDLVSVVRRTVDRGLPEAAPDATAHVPS